MKSTVNRYEELQDGRLEDIQDNYQNLVNDYYDLTTNFYEFGWGQSFHFAPRLQNESFKESPLRHQRFLSDKLSLKSGMQVLDIGCGVGGPMRNFTKWTGANFVGININAYQIECAKMHTKDISQLCRFIHTSNM